MNCRPYPAYLPIATAMSTQLTFYEKSGYLAFLLWPVPPSSMPKVWWWKILFASLTTSSSPTAPPDITLMQPLPLQMMTRSSSALQPLLPQVSDAVGSTRRGRASFATITDILDLQHVSVPHHASGQKTHQEAIPSSFPTVVWPLSLIVLLQVDFYITDEWTKKSFLVDTSSCCSIHLVSPLEKHHPKNISLHLVAANSSTIAIYGTKTFHLSFSDHRSSWTFVLIDMASLRRCGAQFGTILVGPSIKNVYYRPISPW